MQGGKDGAGQDPAVPHLMHHADVHDQQELGDESSIVEAKDEADAEVEDPTVCNHKERRKRTNKRPCRGQHPGVEDEEMVRFQPQAGDV